MQKESPVQLRCVLDGLVLPAEVCPQECGLIAYDGDESFELEAIEARFYEVLSATLDEWLAMERMHYRLLRRAVDFEWS
ncbi:MAG: hypothetical protein U0736_26940 [Gemmataceae bacterium]